MSDDNPVPLWRPISMPSPSQQIPKGIEGMVCPNCKNDDPKLMEKLFMSGWLCRVCSKVFH